MPIQEPTAVSIPLWLVGSGCPKRHPVRVGVPLPRGALRREESVRLLNAQAHPVPIQTEVLARWPDGSIQWLLVDFWAYTAQARSAPVEKAPWVQDVWHLEMGQTRRDATMDLPTGEPDRSALEPGEESTARAVRLDEEGRLLWVDTGPMLFAVDQQRLSPFQGVYVQKTAIPGPSSHPGKTGPVRASEANWAGETQTRVQLGAGGVREAELTGWRVESAGGVRLTLRAEGRFRRARGLRVQAQLSFFSGTGLVCYQLTVHNPHRARHRGGLWDLGDPGSILIQDLSVVVQLKEPILRAVVRTEPAGPLIHLAEALEQGTWRLVQDSSGGPNWQSRAHMNRFGQVPCRLPGYEAVILPEPSESVSKSESGPIRSPVGAARPEGAAGEHSLAVVQGDRALPVAGVQTEQLALALAVPEFWQQFPKALQIAREGVRIGLWPGEWEDLHELQGGEQKTHSLWLDFSPPWPDQAAPYTDQLQNMVDRLGWTHEPIQVVVPPKVWAEAEVLPHFIPAGSETSAQVEAMLAEAIEGPNSLLARREIIDEYGWRHYGDLYADHENAYYPGPKPVVSHYNNQFDVIYGAILQEARTGNPKWRSVYDPLARHVIDIDIYHTQEDRPAYNGGLFWPTDHYRSAETATHRTYTRANLPPDGSPYGGGPGPEHNYATGLLYYYYLTGNRDALQTVVQLAEWVLAMDDGQQTPWGIFDPGPTGLASATRSADYHGPGRGAANSIQTLLDAWLATRHRKYLSKAEELIQRTIHPDDDIESRNLLDAENRWSYTMYLSALARYLEVKAQEEQWDEMYRYTQTAFIYYAAWMAEHERPYLDRPEQLEYITEAWPAQELRKANALRLAARHADEPLRSRLGRRAEQLADRAWADLQKFPTRTSTRALAVVMVEGVRDAYYRWKNDPPARQITGPKHFSRPEPFLPQRERVRQLLHRPGGWVRIAWALVQPANWFRVLSGIWKHRN